jgi:hypothetical protein
LIDFVYWNQIILYMLYGFGLEMISLSEPFEWILKKIDGVEK